MARTPTTLTLAQRIDMLAQKVDDNAVHLQSLFEARDAAADARIDAETRRAADIHQRHTDDIAMLSTTWSSLRHDLYGTASRPGLIVRFARMEDMIVELHRGHKAMRRWWMGILSAVIIASISMVVTSCYGEVVVPTIQAMHATNTPSPTAAPTDWPTPTAAPSVTPTSSIAEVTPMPTQSITEIGTPIGPTPPPPGIVVHEIGIFTPDLRRNIRECPSAGCVIVSQLTGGKPVTINGWVINEVGAMWLCLIVETDSHGTDICSPAVLYRDSDGRTGVYETIQP